MKRLFLIFVLICSSLFSIPIVLPTIVDLTVENSSGVISDAIFQQWDGSHSGTGRFVDFVQLHNDGIEQGYNTSYRPNQFDEGNGLGNGNSANFNRDIQLSELVVANINNQEYAVFILDANESHGQGKKFISLDSVQIFISDTGNRNNYPDLGTLIYDMDYSNPGNTVLIDSSLSHGSGYSDMAFYLPTNLLTGYDLNDYLYFYSSFGEYDLNWRCDAGAEAWGIDYDNFPGYTIPEPSGIILILSIMMLLPICTGRVRGDELMEKVSHVESEAHKIPEMSVSSSIVEGDMSATRVAGINGVLLDITAIRKDVIVKIANTHVISIDTGATVRVAIWVRHMKKFIAIEVEKGSVTIGEQVLNSSSGALYVSGTNVLPNTGALSFIDAVEIEATAYTQSQSPGIANNQIAQLNQIRIDGYRAIHDSAKNSKVIYEPPFVPERPIRRVFSPSGLP